MAVLANQREYVRRPGALTPRYGLFSVVQALGTMIEGIPMPVHAGQGGIEYETSVCDLPTCFETDCIGALGTKPAGETTTIVTGDPFVALTSLSCGLVGLTEDRLRGFLRDRAVAGEQAMVEDTFSQGLCGQAPSLANNTPPAVDVGPATDMVEAISQLEAALYAVYGLPGIIHVPHLAAPYLSQAYDMWRDPAGIWRTAAGSYVSIGNYAGLDPAGGAPAAGSTNVYITGQVSIWRTPESDVFYTPISAALNRTTNQVNGYREREYIVAYECYAFATEVTLATV